MAFVDKVREHLQEVAQAPDGLPVPAPFAVDEAALRRDLLAVLERLEARDPSEAGRRAVAEQHRWWAYGTEPFLDVQESYGTHPDGIVVVPIGPEDLARLVEASHRNAELRRLHERSILPAKSSHEP